MNRNKLTAVTVACIIMLTINISAIAKIKKPVIERGMTKQQVTALLGVPLTSSFDEFGDIWMYKEWRGPFVGGSDVRIYVMFDMTGKVVGCDERTIESNQREEINSQVYSNGVPRINQQVYPHGLHGLNDRDFSTLYKKVSDASFDKDKKDLIEVASLGCYYSCNQCAKILSIFSFDDDKLAVFKLMASHIIDLQNMHIIYRQFTFDDAKKTVSDILQSEFAHYSH